MKDETVDLTFFTWGVPDRGYVWNHSARAVPNLGGRGPAPFLLVHPKTSKEDQSSPLDEVVAENRPPLFREFANLNPFEESIRTFANQRGWLGIGEPVVMPSDENKMVQKGESLFRWQREIYDMKCAIALWRDLQEENVERLCRRIRLKSKDCVAWEEQIPWKDRDRISWPSSATPRDRRDRGRSSRPHSVAERFSSRRQALLEGKEKVTETPQEICLVRCLYRTHHPYLFKEDLTPWNVLQAGKALLAHLVNEKLRGTVSACLLFERKRKLDQMRMLKGHIRPHNLLAAMWVQLSEDIQGQRRIISCMYCNQPIDVTENRRSKRAHAACVHRQKVYRLRWKKKLQSLKRVLAVKGLSREKRQELRRTKAALERCLKGGRTS